MNENFKPSAVSDIKTDTNVEEGGAAISRRGFFKKSASVMAGGVLGGVVGGVAHQEISNVLAREQQHLSPAEVLSQNNVEVNPDAVWSNALEQGDRSVYETLAEFRNAYAEEAESMIARISVIQKRILSGKFNAEVKALLDRQIGFSNDRLNWLRHEIEVYDSRLKNFLEKEINNKNTPTNSVQHKKIVS